MLPFLACHSATWKVKLGTLKRSINQEDIVLATSDRGLGHNNGSSRLTCQRDHPNGNGIAGADPPGQPSVVLGLTLGNAEPLI